MSDGLPLKATVREIDAGDVPGALWLHIPEWDLRYASHNETASVRRYRPDTDGPWPAEPPAPQAPAA